METLEPSAGASATASLESDRKSAPRPRGALRFLPRRLGIEQTLRLGAALLRALLGRLFLTLRAPFATARARHERLEAWRTRSAAGVIRILSDLKGPFAKLGQFAAHRYDVLAPEIHSALASLHDRVPPLPLGQIRPLIEAELGAPLTQLFTRFEPEPIGAASIAQVHRATLPGGEEVAVKVQYPWLESSLRADLAVIRVLLGLALWGRGGRQLDRRRLFDEFARGLGEELDFEQEARAGQEIAANLAHDPQIVVPRVYASHSTRRILTMSFQPAVRVTDREELARLGVAPRSVVDLIARAYAKQVFVDGVFHADPHPGNLFVIDEPGAGERPRVLFVDFGLSQRLDPKLRREMRVGIYAVLQRDLDGFVAAMDRMGMIGPAAEAGVRAAVEAMFERLASVDQPLGLGGSQVLSLKDEAKALLQETRGLQLPNELLLYAKTMSYIFWLGEQLDPEADVMRLSVPYLLQFLGGRS